MMKREIGNSKISILKVLLPYTITSSAILLFVLKKAQQTYNRYMTTKIMQYNLTQIVQDINNVNDIDKLKHIEDVHTVIFNNDGSKIYLDTIKNVKNKKGIFTVESNVHLFKVMKNEISHNFGHLINDEYRVISAAKRMNDTFTIISYTIIS